jgi:branched-chain amino acid transport system substrate-binding protein
VAKRRFILIAPLAVAAVLLAACGSSGSGGGGGGGNKPTYKIGLQGPLSGGNQQLGQNIAFGVKLAINQANAKGDLPFKLEYVDSDDQGKPGPAPTAAQKLIDDSKVMAVVGPVFSGATRSAEPKFFEAHLASISPSASAPDLTKHGWTNFFRLVVDDNSQGPADADYIAKVLKAKSVYVIDDASGYAQPLASAFISKANTNGLTVKHDTATGTTQCQAGNGNAQQYGTVAGKIKRANLDAVFYAGYYCDFALLTKALHSANYTGKLVSDDGSKDSQYVKQAGASLANGAYSSCACSDIKKNPSAGSFITDFKKLAGFDAGTYSGEGYDATNAIISVMKGLGKTVTRQGVLDGIKGINFPGLTKPVKFTADGSFAGTQVFMWKVENGAFVQLGDIAELVNAA